LVETAATTVAVGFGAGCQSGAGPKRRRVEDIREVDQLVAALSSADGAGVKLQRALGHRGLPIVDPFLLLDEIHSDRQEDWIAGFPTHPHRGFETVSYLIAGAFEHRDSVGNHGIIGAGDCQWMTAGRGIVHSEMPRQAAGKDLWGLQLWVNLPAAQKMIAPRYQDMAASQIPELDLGDAHVRVVTGKVGAKQGPVDGIAVAPAMLDVDLPAGAVFRHELEPGDNSFAYLLSGEVQLGARATTARAGHIAVLGKGSHIMASSEAGGRFLLLSAAPIGEPVARRGPFVMNTDQEIRQAFEDYRSGRLTDG
jgi:redox-sensitive bicupin YhaK (pirin superfamily)